VDKSGKLQGKQTILGYQSYTNIFATMHIAGHHVDLRLQTELKEIKGDANGSVASVVTGKGDEIGIRRIRPMVWLFYRSCIFRCDGGRFLSFNAAQGLVQVRLSFGRNIGYISTLQIKVQDHHQWWAMY
jgi:hypothetical protein